MDVHKESISIATAGEGEEVRHYGTCPNHFDALDSVVRKLVGTGHIPYFVYEAGPSGYTIYRHLLDNGLDCMVAAPSLIPRKAGDRIKTDKRDAAMLARLLRAGELTKVHVPDADDEAVRDMFRARCDAKQMEKTARQNLLSFLLRIGRPYTGSRHWTKMHFRWLYSLSLPSTHQLVLQEYLDTIEQCGARILRYDGMLQGVVGQWKREPEVRKLQTLRGVSFLSAVGIIAELGDLRRFTSARQLMAYAGLVSSENSSGRKVRRGSITKTGNRNVRWLLVESAWSYRLKARKSAHLLKRQAGVSAEVAELSWKAQVRLCSRYQRLLQKGKPKGKVIVCIARELAGFIWALGNFTSQEEPRVIKAA
ncbi:MAG: IS110 family transposase [Desulfovibrio sp.]|jgi:transposase|nr:IS110 family transposase [Desulfovibrio sp.]